MLIVITVCLALWPNDGLNEAVKKESNGKNRDVSLLMTALLCPDPLFTSQDVSL